MISRNHIRKRRARWNTAQQRQKENQLVKKTGFAGGDIRSFALGRLEFAVSLFRKMAEFKKITPQTRILEVGSGPHGVTFFYPVGRKVSLDPLARFYRKEFEIIQRSSGTSLVEGVGEDLPFSDKAFDCVVSDNVLDHTADALRVLEEIRRMLKDDGLFLLGINLYPDIYGLYAGIFNVLFALRFPVKFRNFQTHTYFFTPRAITRLLDKCRFTILKRELPPPDWKWFPRKKYRRVSPFPGIFVCAISGDNDTNQCSRTEPRFVSVRKTV
jgi:SAM-dependent methyltransferase